MLTKQERMALELSRVMDHMAVPAEVRGSCKVCGQAVCKEGHRAAAVSHGRCLVRLMQHLGLRRSWA